MRDIRRHIVDKIKANIQENGFYDAKVLTIVKSNDQNLIADGNHRYYALKELGIMKVPCVIFENVDIYNLAIKGNIAEDVYAPMDLFDWLEIIKQLKDEGLTQEEIGNKFNWSQNYISKYLKIYEKINTQIITFCKDHQKGRVLENNTNVLFDFSEGWFRTSGLYDLNEQYQLDCLQRFINEQCRWSKQKLQRETKTYSQWQEFIEIIKSKLFDQSNLKKIVELIENNIFKTKEQLLTKIDDFNRESKNKLICGDAIKELESLEDSIIDIIVADPPYGQNYVSWRSSYEDHIGREGVINDNEEAFELLEQTCEILEIKTKPDAHFYIFCSWKVYPQFKSIIEKYFKIKNVIIWNKLNHGAGDLEGNWGDKYEMIIFATKGKRNLVKRKQNILEIPRIASSELIHPTQKPIQLIKELLEASAQPNDTICDPFMGSGSTIKACKGMDLDLNYIGIEIDPTIFEKAKSFIGE